MAGIPAARRQPDLRTCGIIRSASTRSENITLLLWARSGPMRCSILSLGFESETGHSTLAIQSMVNAVLAHGPGGLDSLFKCDTELLSECLDRRLEAEAFSRG